MFEITIKLADKLKIYLDRYYRHDKSLEDRFFEALYNGEIVTRGKAFYLSTEMDGRLTSIIDKEIQEARDEVIRQRPPTAREYDDYNT